LSTPGEPGASTSVRRLLYLDGYTLPVDQARSGTRAPSSDAIGYGITASAAIRTELTAAGFDVVRPAISAPAGPPRVARLRWLLSSYAGTLDVLSTAPPDAVFCFHAFSTFPVEIRRMELDLGLDLPMVGYTHGSHWDETDSFRFQLYPNLELLDLANFNVMDRILLVSDYLRSTLLSTISAFNKPLAKTLDAKFEVVGLPLDVGRIDGFRTEQRWPRPTVVFNHSPVASKNPAMFVRVMRRVLALHDVQVLFTRRYPPGHAGAAEVAALAAQFPDQVILGNDLPLADYYRTLWMADIQVSTATHESLGISTLEAMHTKTCCILPRLGSYPEIAGDVPDVLYDLGEDELEERLTYFLDSPTRRNAVAADLQRAAARYSPSVVVRRIADVLYSL
jgi:glycosyltransferase involved in cell wall biosynthesis